MLQAAATPPPSLAPFDGSGPCYGQGASRSAPEWAQHAQVSGVPSVVPAVVLNAPPVPFRIGADQFARLQGPLRVAALDLQSYAPAPPVPLNSRPLGTVIHQVNSPQGSREIITLSAPRVPTGGASPCQVR